MSFYQNSFNTLRCHTDLSPKCIYKELIWSPSQACCWTYKLHLLKSLTVPLPTKSTLSSLPLPENTMQLCPTEHDAFSLVFQYLLLLSLRQEQNTPFKPCSSPISLFCSHHILSRAIILCICWTVTPRNKTDFHCTWHCANTKTMHSPFFSAHRAWNKE